MRKKLTYLSIILLFILALTSCDQIESIMSLIPEFSSKLPNNVAGKYAYYSTEADRKAHEYTTLFTFTSTDGTFTEKTEKTESKGTYTVQYKTYAITECNGTITLNYESGKTKSYEFYFYSTAVDGPEYIMLGTKTYYYEGV